MDASVDSTGRIDSSQLLGRLDKMVAAVRLTEEEAERLRAAAESGGLDAAVQELRGKHAQATVGAAVEDGRVSQEEANALLERLEVGEHPRFLRGLRRRASPPVA